MPLSDPEVCTLWEGEGGEKVRRTKPTKATTKYNISKLYDVATLYLYRGIMWESYVTGRLISK